MLPIGMKPKQVCRMVQLELLPKAQMLVTLLTIGYLKNCMGDDFN